MSKKKQQQTNKKNEQGGSQGILGRLKMLCVCLLQSLTLSLPESITEACRVVLTFESVDEILWCDHSNETSVAVLLPGTICFSVFIKMKLGIFLGVLFVTFFGLKG